MRGHGNRGRTRRRFDDARERIGGGFRTRVVFALPRGDVRGFVRASAPLGEETLRGGVRVARPRRRPSTQAIFVRPRHAPHAFRVDAARRPRGKSRLDVVLGDGVRVRDDSSEEDGVHHRRGIGGGAGRRERRHGRRERGVVHLDEFRRRRGERARLPRALALRDDPRVDPRDEKFRGGGARGGSRVRGGGGGLDLPPRRRRRERTKRLRPRLRGRSARRAHRVAHVAEKVATIGGARNGIAPDGGAKRR